MRDRSLRRPGGFYGRRILSAVVRGVVILSMSFGAAFGFLAAMRSPAVALRSARFAIGVGGAVRRRLRRHRLCCIARRASSSRAARAATARRRARRPQLGAQGIRGARAELPGSARRRDRAPRRRRPHHLRQRRLLRARRPHARRRSSARAFALPVLEQGATAHARRRHAHPRPEDRRRDRRALDRLARGRWCAPARAGAEMQSVGRDVTDRVAGRARARRRARPGRSRQPRQVALPGDGLARDPHAAQRHPRHGRPAARHRR